MDSPRKAVVPCGDCEEPLGTRSAESLQKYGFPEMCEECAKLNAMAGAVSKAILDHVERKDK